MSKNINTGVLRLQKEHQIVYKRYQNQNARAEQLDNFVACPDRENLLKWYYVIWGLKDCPYEGGYYLGKIIFPKEYPLKPPRIEMITPNGRFKVNQRICMSMTDYHPESWNPLWNINTIMIGLISFMLSDDAAAGCIITHDMQKRTFAA